MGVFERELPTLQQTLTIHPRQGSTIFVSDNVAMGAMRPTLEFQNPCCDQPGRWSTGSAVDPSPASLSKAAMCSARS